MNDRRLAQIHHEIDRLRDFYDPNYAADAIVICVIDQATEVIARLDRTIAAGNPEGPDTDV